MIKNLSIFFILFISLIHPQDKFKKVSPAQGAPLHLTYAMIQDSRGFIWFGTMYGLYRFDGENYKVFKYNPEDKFSISFDDIISIYEDRDNNLWIGTWGGGLNYYSYKTGKFTRFINDPSNENSLQDNIIWDITEDKQGNIWLASETSGVIKYDRNSNRFIKLNIEDFNKIRTVYADKEGIIWFGTGKGLSRYHPATKSHTLYTTESGLAHNTVFEIFEDSSGDLLIGTFKGLSRFNRSISRFEELNDENFIKNISINSICRDDKQNLWIGTGNGLIKFSLENKNYHLYSSEKYPDLYGNFINKILFDRSGNLWISVYHQGINKLSLKENDFAFIRPEINNKVSSITKDKNENIWAGTRGGGIFKLNGNNISKINSSINYANIIQSDYDDNLWVADRNLLYKLVPSNGSKINIPLPGNSLIISLYADKNNFLWIGTYSDGLYRYDQLKKTFDHFTFDKNKNQPLDYILNIYEDKKGDIWFGTYGGLIKFNEKKQHKIFRHNPSDANSISNNYIFSIYEDSRGNFWIGTANGLNKYDEKGGKFFQWFESDGLPNSVINNISEDNKGTLWLGTNKGVSNFITEKNYFNNYDFSDESFGNLFNSGSIIDKNGNIYYAIDSGILKFHPDSFAKNNFSPQISLTGIKTMKDSGEETEIILSDNIELEYSSNSLIFEFASFDFTNPSGNNYKYKLEGIDSEWIDADKNNYAKYTNLDAGEYIFKVKGTNSNGVWSENTASVSIVINPPFWQTWWFIFTVMFLLVFSSIIIYRHRVNGKIKRALEIENIRRDEAERVRKKTAADFHDELGHRLTRISFLSEMISRKLMESPSAINPLLKKISENSAELYSGTKDFIWSIDPEKDSLYDLIIRLKDFGDELFSTTNILFEVHGVDETLKAKSLSAEWRRHLALIFKEGMNNSLKYSGSRKVFLDTKINNSDVEIILSDDGKGFDKAVKVTGTGIFNMKKRAEKLSANLEIDTAPGSGTKIKFRGKIPELSS